MNILVTGGAGFIGSNFVRYWVENCPDDSVVVFDALTYAGNLENLNGLEEKIHFVRGDITDIEANLAVMKDYKISHVVNFAAESHNSLAVIDPGRFFMTNVIGTQRLLEAARQAKVSRFHHVSTCEVYGDLPLDSKEEFYEDSPYRPRTPYNASKAGADHAVRAYHETYSLNTTITNCANNYGPYQFPEKVIPVFVTNALEDKPLPVYKSSENRREWIHVTDHCRAIELVLKSGKEGETYHVGTKVEKSVNDIADFILDYLGKSSSLKETVPDRPGHDRRYVLNSEKIRRELGWEPMIDFNSGLQQTIDWYVKNKNWWEPLLNKRPVEEASAWLKM